MSPKVLLILLVIIAILTVMIIGTGYQRDRTDRKYEQKTAFTGLDGLFGRFRDPFVVGRISGCSWNGTTFTITSEDCQVAIGPGKSKSSAFKLQPMSGVVRACFGFEQDHLKECVDGDADKRTALKSEGSRFVVGKGQAFLRLYCSPLGGSSCPVRLILEE